MSWWTKRFTERREPAPDAPSNGTRKGGKKKHRPFHVVCENPLLRYLSKGPKIWVLYRCETREHAEAMAEKSLRSGWKQNIWIRDTRHD